MREANELLAHLETRFATSSCRLRKRDVPPRRSRWLEGKSTPGLGRTVEKYTYRFQQELQVFQYRLEKYMRRLASDSMKRETARLADAFTDARVRLELDTSWLRAPIVPLDWDANNIVRR